MELNNNTQLNAEANPVDGAELQPQNEGNQVTTQPQVETNKDNNEGKLYSQQDLDNIAAKARGTAERETKKKLLAQLGLNSDDEDMLQKMKEAYENSLTDEERRNQEIDDLNEENINLMVELDEKDYIIEALIALSGKNADDVKKIVKMAQGLKTEDNTIKDCVAEVMSMVNIGTAKPAGQPILPTGQPLAQPSTTVNINTEANPFKAGQINLTEQGRLFKENPELAKRLALEAGVKLNI